MKLNRKKIRLLIKKSILREGFWDMSDSPVLQSIGVMPKKQNEYQMLQDKLAKEMQAGSQSTSVKFELMILNAINTIAYNKARSLNVSINIEDINKSPEKKEEFQRLMTTYADRIKKTFDLDNDGVAGDKDDFVLSLKAAFNPYQTVINQKLSMLIPTNITFERLDKVYADLMKKLLFEFNETFEHSISDSGFDMPLGPKQNHSMGVDRILKEFNPIINDFFYYIIKNKLSSNFSVFDEILSQSTNIENASYEEDIENDKERIIINFDKIIQVTNSFLNLKFNAILEKDNLIAANNYSWNISNFHFDKLKTEPTDRNNIITLVDTTEIYDTIKEYNDLKEKLLSLLKELKLNSFENFKADFQSVIIDFEKNLLTQPTFSKETLISSIQSKNNELNQILQSILINKHSYNDDSDSYNKYEIVNDSFVSTGKLKENINSRKNKIKLNRTELRNLILKSIK